MARVNNGLVITADGDYEVSGYLAGKLASFLVEGEFDGATVKLQWRKRRPAPNWVDMKQDTELIEPGGTNFAVDTPYLNLNVANAGASTELFVTISPLKRT